MDDSSKIKTSKFNYNRLVSEPSVYETVYSTEKTDTYLVTLKGGKHVTKSS